MSPGPPTPHSYPPHAQTSTHRSTTKIIRIPFGKTRFCCIQIDVFSGRNLPWKVQGKIKEFLTKKNTDIEQQKIGILNKKK